MGAIFVRVSSLVPSYISTFGANVLPIKWKDDTCVMGFMFLELPATVLKLTVTIND